MAYELEEIRTDNEIPAADIVFRLSDYSVNCFIVTYVLFLS